MPPSVEIQTEALGLSAAEVKQLIMLGLEQDLLNGAPWLDRIHSSSMSRLSVIDVIKLSSSSVSPIDMSVLARWKIKLRLMGVPGVANVAIYGRRDRQLQVQADPSA